MSANTCRVYWGSHGCDLPRGHEGWHICGIASFDGICCTPVQWWDYSQQPAEIYRPEPATQIFGEDAKSADPVEDFKLRHPDRVSDTPLEQ